MVVQIALGIVLAVFVIVLITGVLALISSWVVERAEERAHDARFAEWARERELREARQRQGE